MATLNPQFATTANEIPGYRLTRNLGVVRGLVVRSRSVIGNIGATIQTIFGGNITLVKREEKGSGVFSRQLMAIKTPDPFIPGKTAIRKTGYLVL